MVSNMPGELVRAIRREGSESLGWQDEESASDEPVGLSYRCIKFVHRCSRTDGTKFSVVTVKHALSLLGVDWSTHTYYHTASSRRQHSTVIGKEIPGCRCIRAPIWGLRYNPSAPPEVGGFRQSTEVVTNWHRRGLLRRASCFYGRLLSSLARLPICSAEVGMAVRAVKLRY